MRLKFLPSSKRAKFFSDLTGYSGLENRRDRLLLHLLKVFEYIYAKARSGFVKSIKLAAREFAKLPELWPLTNLLEFVN